MRTRTKGIRLEGAERIVDKQYRGQRIFARLGEVSQDDAEAWLRARQSAIDAEQHEHLRRGAQRLFADGAAKYLIECKQRNVRTLDWIALHVKLLLPYVGALPIGEVCNESFEGFVDDRKEEGAKHATINRSLQVARTILNRAARVWRDSGKPWISTSPLIELLDEKEDRRAPRPITWAEQAALMKELPAHLEKPVLFALNTGARDENVVGLRWDWEVKVPELGRSVFVIPAAKFKGKRVHVLILNDAAWNIVEKCRGEHDEFVFVYRKGEHRLKEGNESTTPADRFETINNNGWQRARNRAGLQGVRVHDLRHTFGQRLRDAGVSAEDRALLLGHAIAGDDMPQHYATATVARLVEAANKVQHTVDRMTLLRVVNS
jgi:integrase